MLAQLAFRDLDKTVTNLAKRFEVRYTRYADDLTFSTIDIAFGRGKASGLIGTIYKALARRGLSPNTAKTVISPPGARKTVLGLLVDGARPRLTREFRSAMRMHLHYICRDDVGPELHSRRRGFTSVEGFRQHLLGLVAYAKQVDATYAAECRNKLRSVEWPA